MQGLIRNMQFSPYELTYDKIESVTAKNGTVFLQTSGQTFESDAFNADDIVRAIKARLVQPIPQPVHGTQGRFCSACGAGYVPGVNFCNACGTKLD